MPALKIACIGEVMIELVTGANNSAQMGVAGDTYNSAVYLARLMGDKAQVSYLTALGHDTFSTKILSHITHHGINTDYIERRADKGPGLYAIETDAQGERSFTYWRSDSAARTLFAEPCDIGLERLAEFDVLMLSGITLAILPPDIRRQLIATLHGLRANGTRIVYDSNYRPRLWESIDVARDVNAQLWRNTDIALPSLDDEMALFGDPDHTAVLDRLRGFGCNEGALKRGPEGPVPLRPDAGPQPRFEPATNVVDTTAAGDSFNAGFLAAYLIDPDTPRAMIAGHTLASRVIGQKGAIVAT